ncbi:MAG TPA: hypothetical protein VN851_01870 [Thermoanaerobaculia bacterium]|nr:hypothetical protein [Thermoanaerobaculia bacterium]
MAANPSSTPIAPKGMGPGSGLLLIMLLLGFGAFYWLSHDPNVLDAYSDLKREFEAPAPAAATAAQPSQSPRPPLPSPATGTASSQMQEQFRKEYEGKLAQLEKDLAEAERQMGTHSPRTSRLVFIADPTCAPIGRQWRVSGHVSNPSDKARRGKAEITLLIDGEPAKVETIEVGPVGPQGVGTYQVLFRPSRDTRNRTVTASAAWKK